MKISHWVVGLVLGALLSTLVMVIIGFSSEKTITVFPVIVGKSVNDDQGWGLKTTHGTVQVPYTVFASKKVGDRIEVEETRNTFTHSQVDLKLKEQNCNTF